MSQCCHKSVTCIHRWKFSSSPSKNGNSAWERAENCNSELFFIQTKTIFYRSKMQWNFAKLNPTKKKKNWGISCLMNKNKFAMLKIKHKWNYLRIKIKKKKIGGKMWKLFSISIKCTGKLVIFTIDNWLFLYIVNNININIWKIIKWKIGSVKISFNFISFV